MSQDEPRLRTSTLPSPAKAATRRGTNITFSDVTEEFNCKPSSSLSRRSVAAPSSPSGQGTAGSVPLVNSKSLKGNQLDKVVENSRTHILRQAFDKYDCDGSGSIDTGELKSFLADLNWSMGDECVRRALRVLDEDGSGEIEFTEFQKWTEFAYMSRVLYPEDMFGQTLWMEGNEVAAAHIAELTIPEEEKLEQRPSRVLAKPKSLRPIYEDEVTGNSSGSEKDVENKGDAGVEMSDLEDLGWQCGVEETVEIDDDDATSTETTIVTDAVSPSVATFTRTDHAVAPAAAVNVASRPHEAIVETRIKATGAAVEHVVTTEPTRVGLRAIPEGDIDRSCRVGSVIGYASHLEMDGRALDDSETDGRALDDFKDTTPQSFPNDRSLGHSAPSERVPPLGKRSDSKLTAQMRLRWKSFEFVKDSGIARHTPLTEVRPGEALSTSSSATRKVLNVCSTDDMEAKI